MQAQVVAVGACVQPPEEDLRALAEGGHVHLTEAVLHRRRVEIQPEGVRREMVEVVRLEAGDVRRNLEAGRAKVLVELVVAGAARPLEDAGHPLVDELVGVVPVESALPFVLFQQRQGRRGEHIAGRQQRLDATARGGIEVIRHQQRAKYPVVGIKARPVGGGDDRLALRAQGRHVVIIVRLHREGREESRDAAVFLRLADADGAMSFAAGLLQLRRREREPAVPAAEQRAHGLVTHAVHEQGLVVERHLLAKHPREFREQAVLHFQPVGKGRVHGGSFATIPGRRRHFFALTALRMRTLSSPQCRPRSAPCRPGGPQSPVP